jgi:glutaminyl-peptide cyclotransferase
MLRKPFQVTGRKRLKNRLATQALPWLLYLAAALAALSCAAAGSGSPTAPVPETAPVTSTSPSAMATLPTAGPGLVPPSPTTSTPTQAAVTTPVPSPTSRQQASPVAPDASSTVETVAARCPPLILPGEIPVYSYRILAAYPHDPGAFTQGLIYSGSVLYEGTGLYNGLSSLRKVDLETGEVLQIHRLRTDEFGEGIAVHGERILQLTWLNGYGYIYNRDTFDPLGTFAYPTEGWGLTHDGSRFIMSDGSATLHFWDLDTLEETGQVQVHDEHGPLVCLNELEYVQGQVYANVWQTDYLAVIDPATGGVTAWIDLAGLLESQGPVPSADVLNGIAYDLEGDRLFVTGKWWPWLFEIELVGPLSRSFLPNVGG